ncbi:MBL fold hydrolase [Methanosarcinales archaeon]|nr:MAG: MBL fold hydrolase [Methanosarcinales archaeon]
MNEFKRLENCNKSLWDDTKMKLRIVYDNEADEGFLNGWGFSCLIETAREKVLFDAGWDGNILLHNLKRFGVGREEIDVIVISHTHWDHVGGITHILHPQVVVHLPDSSSPRLKEEIARRAKRVETKPLSIAEHIYTTGEFKSGKEQALVIETRVGLLVVTGCAHPGLETILDAARAFGDVCGLIGGFHGFNRYEYIGDLSMIIPCHCTRYKTRVKEVFGERCRECKTGMAIEI